MKVIHLCFNVLGRFFISLVFLAGAVNKILQWHENEKEGKGELTLPLQHVTFKGSFAAGVVCTNLPLPLSLF